MRQRISRRCALRTLGGAGIGLVGSLVCRGGGGGDGSRTRARSPTSRPGRAFRQGLHEVADGVWAYLQPDGGWGLANAGLVTGGDSALLVDTLFDLALTDSMLAAMRRTTRAAQRIGTVVNTHANGDHWFGNVLVADAEIVASAACAEEMTEMTPVALAGLVDIAGGLGPAGSFVREVFGAFEFHGIEPAFPTRTFSDTLDLAVGDRVVRLVEVGPAHTRGDVVVHLPDDGVVLTGDILFNGVHPLVWTGPVRHWIAACDRLLGLDGVSTFVPGHGPLATRRDVVEMRDYLDLLVAEVVPRHAAGMSPLEAARDVDMGPYAGWTDPERLAANVTTVYAELGADVATDPVSLFGQMAALAGA